jgi:RasGEF domain/RasGEF N-terminal motif
MSNTRTDSGSRSRRVGELRPRLRFADEITQKSSRLPTVAEENGYIDSDGVAPALSEGHSRSRSSFDAKEFTAISKIAEQVRAVSDNLDMDFLHSLAGILILSLENMLRSFKSLPLRLRSKPSFDVAFRGVIFFARMFARHTGDVTLRLSGMQLADTVQLSLQSLDMMMASLEVLFDLVEHPVTQRKPLPDVPAVDSTLTSPIHETTVMGLPIHATASHDNVNVTPPPVFTAEGGSNVPMPLATFATTKASLRRLVSGLHNRKSNLRPPTLRSGMTSSKPSGIPWIPRVGGYPSDRVPTALVSRGPLDHGQQARMYCAGTVFAPPSTEQSVSVLRNFTQEVNTELPASTLELHFSSDGVLCAASLAALVCMLTSTEALKDPTFDNFFFVSFRFFSKPIEIFNLLVAQYDEDPREHLDPAIDPERDASVAKVRVARVFFLWLRFHWRHQWDAEVVQPLRQFASTRPADDPAPITWKKVIRKLNHASRGIDYRGSRIQRIAQTQLTRHTPTPVSPQCRLLFKEVISQGDLDKVDILYFHNPTGREELARQLCLAASELFRDIDPEDAARYWTDGQSKSVRAKILRLASFENALAYWTSNTIVARPTVRSRAEVMEFFIEVTSVRKIVVTASLTI